MIAPHGQLAGLQIHSIQWSTLQRHVGGHPSTAPFALGCREASVRTAAIHWDLDPRRGVDGEQAFHIPVFLQEVTRCSYQPARAWNQETLGTTCFRSAFTSSQTAYTSKLA